MESRSLAHSVALRQGDLDSAKRRKPAANRLCQVSFGARGGGQSGAQDLTRLFLHRASVVGGANPQAGFGFLVQLPDGECGHTAMIALLASNAKRAVACELTFGIASVVGAAIRRLRLRYGIWRWLRSCVWRRGRYTATCVGALRIRALRILALWIDGCGGLARCGELRFV